MMFWGTAPGPLQNMRLLMTVSLYRICVKVPYSALDTLGSQKCS